MEANGKHLVEQFSALVDYSKARLVGQLFVPSCTTPEAIPEKARHQAVELAKDIVK
jgi:hypothetical protein